MQPQIAVFLPMARHAEAPQVLQGMLPATPHRHSMVNLKSPVAPPKLLPALLTPITVAEAYLARHADIEGVIAPRRLGLGAGPALLRVYRPVRGEVTGL